MKTSLSIFTIILLGLAALQCKKDSSPTAADTSPLTETEKQAIVQTYQGIAATADTILHGENPIAGFQRMLATYQSYANVTKAWVDSTGLYVAFKRAGGIQWYIAPDVVIPPYDRAITLPVKISSPNVRLSGGMSTRVCLINSMDQDESRTVYRDYFAYMKRKFENSGFQVTIVNGAAANVQFFKTGLKQFGVVIIYAHGRNNEETGRTWLQTGEVGSVQGLVANYSNEIQAGQIDMFDVEETRGGQQVTTPYYAVSDNFIRSAYASGDFPGTVVYLGSCQALKFVPMSQALAAAGAAAVIGWTETNRVGPYVAKPLFSFLLCGKSLQNVVDVLPGEAKRDLGAQLVYYPPAAGSFRLVATERRAVLNLVRPLKDSVYTTRTLNLQGNLMSGDSISLGTVELNAVALRLALLSDRKSFLQQVGIKSGTNNIRIAGLVDVSNGCACVDSSYTFRGNFGTLDLWTELRWNTDGSDVDFHLLPPGATFPGSFWTTTDCYYGNRSPSWGGFLDVDNVSGRGPEHITIPTVSVQGTYRLFVHYYSAHGAGATSAFVSVSVRNGPNEEFGPLALSNSASRGGDVWEVCKISFPDGTITPVKSKTTLTAMDNFIRFDDKSSRK